MSSGYISSGKRVSGSLGKKFFTLNLQVNRDAALLDMYLPKLMLSSLYLIRMDEMICSTGYPLSASLSSH